MSPQHLPHTKCEGFATSQRAGIQCTLAFFLYFLLTSQFQEDKEGNWSPLSHFQRRQNEEGHPMPPWHLPRTKCEMEGLPCHRGQAYNVHSHFFCTTVVITSIPVYSMVSRPITLTTVITVV